MQRTAEINDAAPTSLRHLVGQRGVVAQVEVALEAAFADGKKLDDCLMVGPPGLGKTQVAKVIASELATTCHEILGQAVDSPADLNAILLAARDRDVVFIDECHELQREHQTALYLAIDQRRIVLSGGRSGRSPQSIPIADFTLLLATTDEYCLLQPLRDRMKLTLRFGFYGEGELAEVLRHRSRALGWPVEEEVLALIARRSRGTPRLALRLLQSCRRVARSEGHMAVEVEHLQRACLLEGVDLLGLGPTEKECLRIVAEGPARLNVVASRLGLPARTVSQVIEPFLLRAGLIEKDHQGRRVITTAGREHLSTSDQGDEMS